MKAILSSFSFDFSKAQKLANEQHYNAFEQALLGTAEIAVGLLGSGRFSVVGMKPNDTEGGAKIRGKLARDNLIDREFAHAVYWSQADEVEILCSTMDSKWRLVISCDPICFKCHSEEG